MRCCRKGCNQGFDTRDELSEHYAKDHNSMMCSEEDCVKAFQSVTVLRTHKREWHEWLRPYCAGCRRFMTTNAFNNHKSGKHRACNRQPRVVKLVPEKYRLAGEIWLFLGFFKL